MSMGSNIKSLREQKKLSQGELAAAVGRTQQAIDSWEHGRSKPPSDIVIRLADFFGVTTDYIYGRNPMSSLYLRLAKGAEEMELDEEDVNYILSFYSRHKNK